MNDCTDLFPGAIAFDRSADLDGFLREVPARGAVCLLRDAGGLPIQLLCTGNLRADLKRRLGEGDAARAKRQVDYRQVVAWVNYARVDSAFESDLLYLSAARRIFPDSYRGLVSSDPAWFIHLDPAHPYPRYVRTQNLSGPGRYFGPVENRRAAGRLIELVEDCFDLCRYDRILTQSPNGSACAYKSMGRCPAPCDGSISMTNYRQLIDFSARTLQNPAPLIDAQTRRMAAAAAEQCFEMAGKIKAHIGQLSELGAGPFRFLRTLDHFRFLSLQRGPGRNTAKVFLIAPGAVELLACLPRMPVTAADLRHMALQRAQEVSSAPIDQAAVERIGVVAHHLFQSKRHPGAFLPLGDLDERSILRAFAELHKRNRRAPAAEPGDDAAIE